MQLSDIITSVRTRTGYGDTDPILSDAVLTLLINDSLRRISLKENWPWLEVTGTANTVAATSALTLPANRKVRWLRYQDRNITYVNQRDTADYYGRTVAVPFFYTEESGVIHLLPAPIGVIPIEYGITKEADTVLVNPSDQPLLPDWARELLISDTSLLVARRKRDREMEKVYYAEGAITMAEILDECIKTTEGFTPRHTRTEG